MTKRSAHARAKAVLRLLPILFLALAPQLALGGTAVFADTPTPAPTATATTPPATATATEEPEPTKEPKPTRTPTPSPTPVPSVDISVSLFNNFCEAGQPLLATVLNASPTPLQGGTVRVRLFGAGGLLEEHDHHLSLAPTGSTNLPLSNTASPPWIRVDVALMSGGIDTNPNNDSVSCGVTAEAAPTIGPAETADSASGEVSNVVPGTSSRAAPPPASGIGNDSVWRQAEPTPTPTVAPLPTVAPASAPASAQPIANGPQPSLTPIGDAGGGVAPANESPFPSRTLMMTGVVLLAAGSSWAFYYLTRPPRNA